MAPNANGLTLTGSSSQRKSSAKEKRRRQKDAERVEKLRLLVSYLKSGSSQPLLHPVELEAEEIELAQKYNQMHSSPSQLALAFADQSEVNQRGMTGSKSSPFLLDGSSCASTTPHARSDHLSDNHQKSDHTRHNHFAIDGTASDGVSKANSNMNISCSENSENDRSRFHLSVSCRSVPACEDGSSAENIGIIASPCEHHMRAHHHQQSTNHNAYIGTISWVLRHSISDPGTGNQLATMPSPGGRGSSGSGDCDGDVSALSSADHFLVSGSANHCAYTESASSLMNQQDHHHPDQQVTSYSYTSDSSVNDQAQSPSSICATSDHVKGSSSSSIHKFTPTHDTLHTSKANATVPQPPQKLSPISIEVEKKAESQQQIKMEGEAGVTTMVTTATNNLSAGLNQCNCDNFCPPPPPPSTSSIPSATKLFYISDDTATTPSGRKESCSGSDSNSSQLVGLPNDNTGADVGNNIDKTIDSKNHDNRNRDHRLTSSLSDPQNLAAWIDKEVNSLVYDLEVKSQLIMKEKHTKSGGKYRWFRV